MPALSALPTTPFTCLLGLGLRRGSHLPHQAGLCALCNCRVRKQWSCIPGMSPRAVGTLILPHPTAGICCTILVLMLALVPVLARFVFAVRCPRVRIVATDRASAGAGHRRHLVHPSVFFPGELHVQVGFVKYIRHSLVFPSTAASPAAVPRVPASGRCRVNACEIAARTVNVTSEKMGRAVRALA